MTDEPKDIFGQQRLFDAAVARLEKEERDKVYCAAPSEPVSGLEPNQVSQPPKKEELSPLRPKPPRSVVEPYVVWTTRRGDSIPVEELPSDLSTFCTMWTDGVLRRDFRLKLHGGSWEDIGVWLQCVGSDGPQQQLAAPMLSDQLLDCCLWFRERSLVSHLLSTVELLPGALAKLLLPRKDMMSIVAEDAEGKDAAVLNNQRYIYPRFHKWDALVLGEPSIFLNPSRWEHLFHLVTGGLFEGLVADNAMLVRLMKQAASTSKQVVIEKHNESLDCVEFCRNLLWGHALPTNKVVVSSDRLATLWPDNRQPETQEFLSSDRPLVCSCDVLCYGPPHFDIFSALEPGSLFLPASPATLGVRYTADNLDFYSVDTRPRGGEAVGIYAWQHVATVIANAHAVAGVINPIVKEENQ
jgi:hypothetical protein